MVLGLSGLVANTTVWYLGLKYTTALNAASWGRRLRLLAVSVALSLGTGSARALAGDRAQRGGGARHGGQGPAAVLSPRGEPRRPDHLASQSAWVLDRATAVAARSTPATGVDHGGRQRGGRPGAGALSLLERPWEHWRAWTGWLVVLYGALPITLGHLWFYQVIRTLGAGRTVTFLNLMPFAVLALSWLLVGETLHAYHVAGAALVAAGVYLATRPT